MIKERIKIMKKTETRVNGKPTFKDEEVYSCWAEVLSLYGKELYEAINIKFQNTIEFKIRYCKKAKELLKKEDYRVIYDGSEYTLYQPDFSKYPKKYVLLKCNLIK